MGVSVMSSFLLLTFPFTLQVISADFGNRYQVEGPFQFAYPCGTNACNGEIRMLDMEPDLETKHSEDAWIIKMLSGLREKIKNNFQRKPTGFNNRDYQHEQLQLLNQGKYSNAKGDNTGGRLVGSDGLGSGVQKPSLFTSKENWVIPPRYTRGFIRDYNYMWDPSNRKINNLKTWYMNKALNMLPMVHNGPGNQMVKKWNIVSALKNLEEQRSEEMMKPDMEEIFENIKDIMTYQTAKQIDDYKRIQEEMLEQEAKFLRFGRQRHMMY